jgi:hypothetical protein
VTIRAAIAASTAAAFLLVTPTRARADELSPAWIAPPPIELSTSRALVTTHASMLGTFAPSPAPILSRGAKTAIIVGSIVGGILIIAGIIVLSRPGRDLP